MLRRDAGFSLIELIVVIVITGIIASVVGAFIAGPIRGYFDQARRAALVDAAQVALTRMSRDLRGALPNSVRISGGALELLETLDGERYRAEAPGGADDRLDANASDLRFNSFAPLHPPAPLVTPYSFQGSLAIYPLRQPGADPYVAADGVLTPPGTVTVTAATVDGHPEYRLTLPAPHAFPFDSPGRRVFLVRGPVTWLCSNGALLRYDAYPVQSVPPTTEAGFDALVPSPVKTVVVRHVERCGFRYDPGTAQRNAVVSVSLVLMAENERVRLIRQVHVDNAP